MRAPLMVSHLLVMLQHASIVTAQPPKPGGDITCTEGQQATGDSSKIGTGTALLGAIACTDPGAVAYRRTLPESVAGPIDSGGTTDGLATVNIYGPFEAGFTNAQPGMSCLGTNAVAGGIDTSTAELVIQHLCSDATLKIIDTCGDHASPRHFHEYLTDCLTSRTTSVDVWRLVAAGDRRRRPWHLRKIRAKRHVAHSGRVRRDQRTHARQQRRVGRALPRSSWEAILPRVLHERGREHNAR